MLHAKTLVANGYASVVGSSNLDSGSFRLNAECNLVILDEAVGGKMASVFEEDLGQSAEVLPGEWARRGRAHPVADRLARLLSPVL